MHLHRRPTRWLSNWLTVLLLFMQIATAAHACAATVSAAKAPVARAEMPGCDGNMRGSMDPEQPQLCQAHCQQGSQTVHPTPASDAPAAPVLLAVLDWTHTALLPAQPASRARVITAGGSPPLYLRLLVLRN